jgi:hypothetical protein
MLMLYDYSLTVVLYGEASPHAETFNHAIIADSAEHRVPLLRRALNEVDGRILRHAVLMAARALTLDEMKHLQRSNLTEHPLAGVFLTRQIVPMSDSFCAESTPRIIPSRSVCSMNHETLRTHRLSSMFPGQFLGRSRELLNVPGIQSGIKPVAAAA